ncbi:MAG: hypothetical protein GY852_09670 [bacterium]|nr:hypothetical protein [bacterium]
MEIARSIDGRGVGDGVGLGEAVGVGVGLGVDVGVGVPVGVLVSVGVGVGVGVEVSVGVGVPVPVEVGVGVGVCGLQGLYASPETVNPRRLICVTSGFPPLVAKKRRNDPEVSTVKNLPMVSPSRQPIAFEVYKGSIWA